MKNLSIKLQLSLTALAMGFVLLLAQLGLQFYVLRSDIVQRIEKHEYAQLTEFASHLDDKLQESMSMLSTVALNAPVKDMSDLVKLESFLQREHALLTVFDDLYVFDASGVLLVDWPMKPGRQTLDMSSRDYIKGVIDICAGTQTIDQVVCKNVHPNLDIIPAGGRAKNPTQILNSKNFELMLSDLESLEKRVPAAQKKAAQGDKENKLIASVLGQALELLREGKPARLARPTDEEELRVFNQAQLLTAKPVLYVCNVEEDSAAEGNAFSAKVFEKAKAEGANAVIVSAAIESELTGMDDEERMVFLEEMGLHETGLARVIRSGYDLLHLITFFTVGPKEARAWTVHQGAKAPEAAGEIHSDMQRGFIRAETIAYDDYVANKGETGAREAGKFRLEGKDYVVQDGDVLHFKFNV